MPGFAEKIDDHPMLFAKLNGIDPGQGVRRASSHNQSEEQDGMVALAPEDYRPETSTAANGLAQQ